MLFFVCKEALYSSITWKKEALPHMTFGPKMEFSISDRVRKKLVSHINFNPGEKNFFHFLWTLGRNRFTLYNIAHTIRPGWKLNAVTRWNQTELVPEWNFTRLYNHLRVKSNLYVSNFRGLISLRGEISFVMVDYKKHE